MTSAQIRQSFLDFFREKQHTIVPSSSLLPDAPNLLFTNAGMNQFVPIFLGQQKPSWNPPRVADTQKCIRAGGKHNDLEDVGLDTYHHTFFEMLGNWSFGDYFKKEAIEWAWELVVRRWGLPPQRLYATVYKPGPGEPSEFDQEAHDHWARLFREADLDPAIHIVNGNKKDNFWMMGDTGPCGPCSELHVDLTPDGDTRGSLVNKDDPRCIEIWNLVFIQFNAEIGERELPARPSEASSFTASADAGKMPADATRMVALPQRHVDTGMGFERAVAIIQGTKNFTDFSGIVSNYETDVFRSIFDEIEKLSGKKYASTLPERGVTQESEQEKIDIAFRVIADHIRTLSFAIADGIIPSNEGRGYVLRRILRRAVRYGRTLGFHEPFFFKLVDTVATTLGDVFPEVRSNQSRVQEAIRREEESFNKTLDKGIDLFEREVARLVDARSALGSAGFQPVPAGILPDGPKGDTKYWKRRLPHYERPHGIYHVAFSTKGRRALTPAARTIVLNAIRHFHKERYELFAACVMPDHVHVLLEPMVKKTNDQEKPEFFSLKEIFHSLKSFTANEINKTEKREGDPVWEREYHDRLMRSDADVEEKFLYICRNPWTENVVRQDEEYPWVWTWGDEAAGRQDAGQSEQDARAPQDVSKHEALTISGAFAFRLYDEQGFPLDLTQLMARERGLTVDVAGFEKLMDEQRSRARAAQKKSTIELAGDTSHTPTNFLGYEHDHASADVQDVIAVKDRTAVVLNNSVCYAEMGGQVGDTGEIEGEDRLWKIVGTQKTGDTWIHLLSDGGSPESGKHVTVRVDAPRRRAIERHHTVTHILHWALHELVSREAVQKGSYVGPEKLTFDFSSAALTKKQVRDLEKMVSEKVAENAPVSWKEIPYTEAKKRSDIQQFFGDKYGDLVRVVQIGGEPNELNGYSMELCGGTHVRATGEIGAFRIVREEAIAAGIRRIEAVAGGAAKAWAIDEARRQDEKFQTLARKKSDIAALPAFSDTGETNAMLQQIDARTTHLEKLEFEVRDWEKQNAKAAEANVRSRAAAIAKELVESHAGKNSVIARVEDGDGKLLQSVADVLKTKFSGPIFLAGAANGTVALVASVPGEFASKIPANKLIQEVAPIVGGKGGGRPDNARGAGNDPAKIEDALARARELIGE